jgi:hypothetical protein
MRSSLLRMAVLVLLGAASAVSASAFPTSPFPGGGRVAAAFPTSPFPGGGGRVAAAFPTSPFPGGGGRGR